MFDSRHDAVHPAQVGRAVGDCRRGITAVKQCPLVARWASTRLGRGCGWRLAGSEKLSGLDILTVACIRKTTRETLKKLALGEGQRWRLFAFCRIGHNSRTVIFELVNHCASSTIPSGCLTAGRTAMVNLPGVSSPIFAFIPVVRSNPDVWRPCRSLGASQYRMMPKRSRYGSITQTKPDVSPGTAVTGKTTGSRSPQSNNPASIQTAKKTALPHVAEPFGSQTAYRTTDTGHDYVHHDRKPRRLPQFRYAARHAPHWCRGPLLQRKPRLSRHPTLHTLSWSPLSNIASDPRLCGFHAE